jgi:hypothetical protein
MTTNYRNNIHDTLLDIMSTIYLVKFTLYSHFETYKSLGIIIVGLDILGDT